MSENEKGYTLIEVLVALVLLFLIVTPSTYVGTKIMTGSNLQERYVANTLAIQLMETSLLEQAYTHYRAEEVRGGRAFKLERNVSWTSATTSLVCIRVFRRSKEIVALHRTIHSIQASR